jgi:uncharacterized protein with HEPN domain
MRREILYLTDIVESADHVGSFISGIDFQEFLNSEMMRSAAGRVSLSTRSRAPEAPWPQIVAFSNILVHAYFGLDWEEVWRAAKHRCPALRDQVARLLEDVSET